GLKAIISICSTVDRYADDIHYKGGALLNENLGWASQMLAYSSRAPDPAMAPNSWREMWLERLENQPFHLEEWLDHQTRDDFWKHGSIIEDYTNIEAAVLSIGGWHDGYRNTISHLVSNLSAPVKGIIGPWIHKYPHIAGPQPAIGFLQEAKRWWDHWLKDIDTGVEDDPDMRIYVMDSIKPKAWLPVRPGRWIAENNWPSENIVWETLNLTDQGLLSSGTDCNVSVCSPADCGSTGGEYFPFAYGPEFPTDQRTDDAMSACFDGEPLGTAVDLVGAAKIRLSLSANKPAAQIAVRLCDVFPDGTSALIAHGMLNLQHRESHETPKAVVPGEKFEVNIALDDCGYRLPKGHKLRVAIQTNYWPFLWPAAELTTVEIHGGTVQLPTRPLADSDEWTFEPPETSSPWKIESHRSPKCTRTREIDLETGDSVMRMTNDGGHVTDLDHGLSTSSITQEEWRINTDNPLTARANIHWFTTMGRDDWQTSTEAKSSMTADAQAFHIAAELRTWEGDDLVFERHWKRSIPRNGM
ncbi:MAG: CocE/NonD family hydrolase, partial [Paracoccaceae bacterium]|nr:CocE/NonD family hydrolase [Paracoccaceae bacterium]